MSPEPALEPEEQHWSRYPGTRLPSRSRSIDSHGVRLAVHEWGDADAPPLLLAHGGFDFAATLCGFAPLLADGGWRVVSWDQRGHGDSAHPELYSWESDVRDAVAVIDSVTPGALPMIGHSKGGSVLTQLAVMCPHRFTHFVNIDGLPSKRLHPDVAEHERTRLLAKELGGWLDHRRRVADKVRKPGTLEELAKRRGRMNPRLSHEWLCFLVTVGARKDADGWRWKIDPSLRFGGFGPWRPDWGFQRLPGLSMPLLGILASVFEPMGWPATREDLAPWLPADARIEVMEDTGHFVHIERPREVADLVLEFLA